MVKILIIGCGSWGLSISSVISDNASNDDYGIESLTLYSRTKLDINKTSIVSHFHETDNHKTKFINNLNNNNVTQSFDLAFIAIPLSSFEDFFIQNNEFCKNNVKNFVICSKGYVKSTLQNSCDYLSGLFADKGVCVLSGPNFASEILNKHPTITTIASKDSNLLNAVGNVLKNDFFNIQQTFDVNGLCTLGLCKNAIAIGYGLICDYQDSTNLKSMFLSLIYNETYHFLLKSGGDTSTINLSCGIGDIFLSCSDKKSRNVSFGINFAQYTKDKRLTTDGVIQKAKSNQTVEGIDSIVTINSICKKYNLHLPIYQNIHNLLKGEITYENFIKNTLHPNVIAI